MFLKIWQEDNTIYIIATASVVITPYVIYPRPNTNPAITEPKRTIISSAVPFTDLNLIKPNATANVAILEIVSVVELKNAPNKQIATLTTIGIIDVVINTPFEALNFFEIINEYNKNREEKIKRLVYNREEPIIKEAISFIKGDNNEKI